VLRCFSCARFLANHGRVWRSFKNCRVKSECANQIVNSFKHDASGSSGSRPIISEHFEPTPLMRHSPSHWVFKPFKPIHFSAKEDDCTRFRPVFWLNFRQSDGDHFRISSEKFDASVTSIDSIMRGQLRVVSGFFTKASLQAAL